MARAVWSGAITFGLVTIPVGLYSATEDHTPSTSPTDRARELDISGRSTMNRDELARAVAQARAS
jgi:DNA end-binding protein Ku